MFVEAVVIGFVVAWLRGGRLRHDFEFRYMWLAPAAFLAQLLNTLVVPTFLQAPVTVVSYALLLCFACFNLRNQGVRIILVSMLLNALVILVNGGHIPVDVSAAKSIGIDVTEIVNGTAPMHAALTAHTLLPFLGDVIPVPYPFPRIISAGDLFAVLGVFLLIQHMMGKPIVLMRSEESSLKDTGCTSPTLRR